jgi:hypothetical protein
MLTCVLAIVADGFPSFEELTIVFMQTLQPAWLVTKQRNFNRRGGSFRKCERCDRKFRDPPALRRPTGPVQDTAN